MLNEEQIEIMNNVADDVNRICFDIAKIMICSDNERLNYILSSSEKIRSMLGGLRKVAEIQANKPITIKGEDNV